MMRKFEAPSPLMTNFLFTLNARRSVVEPLGDNASLSSIMYTALINCRKQTNKHNIIRVFKTQNISKCYCFLLELTGHLTLDIKLGQGFNPTIRLKQQGCCDCRKFINISEGIPSIVTFHCTAIVMNT